MSCADGIRDLEESDVVCGGPNCAPCAALMQCFEDADCESGFCDRLDNRCRAPSCGDGVQNGLETDEDCGGAQCALCLGFIMRNEWRLRFNDLRRCHVWPPSCPTVCMGERNRR